LEEYNDVCVKQKINRLSKCFNSIKKICCKACIKVLSFNYENCKVTSNSIFYSKIVKIFWIFYDVKISSTQIDNKNFNEFETIFGGVIAKNKK